MAVLSVCSDAHLRPIDDMDVAIAFSSPSTASRSTCSRALFRSGSCRSISFPLTITWLHVAATLGGASCSPAARACVHRRVDRRDALPVLGIFHNGPQIVADRYSYLASLGWALFIGGLAARRGRARRLRGVLAGWILSSAR